ncbi:MAG: VOC family protein [Acidimicrobiales bacterium]
MRITTIDHLIVPVADLAAAAAPFERLGLNLTPPMHHAGAGTSNRVFFVGNEATEFYVELLAGGGERGEVRLMLQVDSADAAAEALAEAGIRCDRREVYRDDSSLIGSVVNPRTRAAGCGVGLIEYDADRLERVAGHRAAGRFEHELELRRLDHLAVITADLDATARFWAEVLGVPVAGEVTGRGMVIRQLRIGDAVLELVGADRPPGLVPMAAFEVADLDAAAAHVRARGVAIEDPAPSVLPASRVARCSPDGRFTLQLIEWGPGIRSGP